MLTQFLGAAQRREPPLPAGYNWDMEPNPYEAPGMAPKPVTVWATALLRYRAHLVVLALGLPVALYFAGYLFTDVAPEYGVSRDGRGTTRLYRWRVEAFAYSPAGRLESLVTGQRVNVESADRYVFHLH